MSAGLTPTQALRALLPECEKTLDYRAEFRAAMADGYIALSSVGAPAADDDVTFGDLFGEPDPSTFEPRVVSVAQQLGEVMA